MIAPARDYARDGMALDLGIVGWCASPRQLKGRGDFVLVVLIITLSGWMIAFSPDACR